VVVGASAVGSAAPATAATGAAAAAAAGAAACGSIVLVLLTDVVVWELPLEALAPEEAADALVVPAPVFEVVTLPAMGADSLDTAAAELDPLVVDACAPPLMTDTFAVVGAETFAGVVAAALVACVTEPAELATLADVGAVTLGVLAPLAEPDTGPTCCAQAVGAPNAQSASIAAQGPKLFSRDMGGPPPRVGARVCTWLSVRGHDRTLIHDPPGHVERHALGRRLGRMESPGVPAGDKSGRRSGRAGHPFGRAEHRRSGDAALGVSDVVKSTILLMHASR
jgi:hypothetical protein